MELGLTFFIEPTIQGAPHGRRGPKGGIGGPTPRWCLGRVGTSYPGQVHWSVVRGPWCSCAGLSLCSYVWLHGAGSMVHCAHGRARKKPKGIVVLATAALLMNRACASLVSALRVSIVPSLRSAVAAPRFARTGTRFASASRGIPLDNPLLWAGRPLNHGSVELHPAL